MAMSKMYTTDGKVRWFANEEDVNTKLISMLGEKFETYSYPFHILYHCWLFYFHPN